MHCTIKKKRCFHLPSTLVRLVVLTVLSLLASTVNGMVLRSLTLKVRQRAHSKYPASRTYRMASSTMDEDLPEYEVEQKFALDSSSDIQRIETRLRELGFDAAKNSITMVDWYWEDVQENSWPLTTQDYWLRYRQTISKHDTNGNTGTPKSSGSWQLKLGRKVSNSETNTGGRATVYEELAGPEAITKAMALLPAAAISRNGPSSPLLGLFLKEVQHPLPAELLASISSSNTQASLPMLAPFAKIETQRSSWIPTKDASDYQGLKVDLDRATYGGSAAEGDVYAVGEVEQVVHNEKCIGPARANVQFLTQRLLNKQTNPATTTTAAPVVMGKLEHYLIHHCPDHFQALVDKGILQ